MIGCERDLQCCQPSGTIMETSYLFSVEFCVSLTFRLITNRSITQRERIIFHIKTFQYHLESLLF